MLILTTLSDVGGLILIDGSLGTKSVWDMERYIGEIPTDNPTFSTMPQLDCDAANIVRPPEFKMADVNQEHIVFKEWNEVSAKFQQLYPHFRLCPTRL